MNNYQNLQLHEKMFINQFEVHPVRLRLQDWTGNASERSRTVSAISASPLRSSLQILIGGCFAVSRRSSQTRPPPVSAALKPVGRMVQHDGDVGQLLRPGGLAEVRLQPRGLHRQWQLPPSLQHHHRGCKPNGHLHRQQPGEPQQRLRQIGPVWIS